MVDGARIQEFWSLWRYEPHDSAKFARFRVRVLEVVRAIWVAYFRDSPNSSHNREKFALLSGTALSPYPGFEQSGLYKLLQANSLNEIAEAVQYLLWTLETISLSSGAWDYCCRELQRVFDLSPGIPIRLVKNGDKATIFPAGAALLDDVIDADLGWLMKYPDVLKPFREALNIYMAKDPNQYRNMLDNLRFAIEQMLRVVLKNQKSLENQKDEFLQWLKSKGVHVQIGNMYHSLLFGGFTKYQNDAVKHQEDAYTAPEVEFVLYATGSFLRLIQRLTE